MTVDVRARPSIVLCDLDGVVWLARRVLDGAPAAVERLRGAGCRVLFVTNNSADRIAAQEAALAAIGIPAEGQVVTSAMAAARLVAPGERVHVCGGVGIVEALIARGAHVLDEDDPGGRDVVVVGIDREFDYRRLTIASGFVRAGARLVATNDDATYPTPDGPIPGGGAIVAAVATAAGVAPVVAGKPHRQMADAVGVVAGRLDPATTLVVGDRPSTDGSFAATIGCGFALVRSGVTAPGVDPD
ncbi:MAG: HAD-IIA family hydrolase, partial [Ilumatobacteraceae bacterium]